MKFTVKHLGVAARAPRAWKDGDGGELSDTVVFDSIGANDRRARCFIERLPSYGGAEPGGVSGRARN